jgi:predicted metal-binding membrane protein
VLTLFAIAGVGWWWTLRGMSGMAGGPWVLVGGAGWFLGTWIVMMAAMMLPSVAPTVALYARMTRTRTPLAPLAFTSGYLLVWAGAGLVALALATATSALAEGALDWDAAGRPLTVATLLAAAGYELTPLKRACLSRCRSPLGFLLTTWRDGWRGGLQMGARLGAWCLGCCWALMAALFALGVMNVAWMALVAALIAAEKMLPWRRVASLAVVAVLAVLGALALAAPGAVPGLAPPARPAMPPMNQQTTG